MWAEPQAFDIPNSYLKNWLLDTGSLTERLLTQCQSFQLVVIGQAPVKISLDESSLLCKTATDFIQEEWQVREVLLCGDGQPWVFARSIIPMELWDRDFSGLSNTPIGKLIFNDPRFTREPFQITQLKQSNTFLKQLALQGNLNLWGRRSVFNFEHLKMIVCEVFLPDSPIYQNLGATIGSN